MLEARDTLDANAFHKAVLLVTGERLAVSLIYVVCNVVIAVQWRRQDFVTGGSEVWVYRGSRVRSPPVPVVLSVYQRGSLLDGLAMYLSCVTKKFQDNESTHILHNFWTSTHRGELPPFPPDGATVAV